MFRRDAYFHQLERELDQGTLQECINFINKVRECRHKKVQDRQIKKFNALEQKQVAAQSKMSGKTGKKMAQQRIKSVKKQRSG